MPKRVYICRSPEDDTLGFESLMQALRQAGLELELRREAIAAAIVVVGPAALNSASVVSDARDLLKRQSEQSFPVVPLLLDGISLAELRSSGLHVLAGIQMSTAATLADRITETLATIETPAAEGISRPAEHPNHPFTTIRTINAGAPVTAVALGQAESTPILVVSTQDGPVQVWRLREQGGPAHLLQGHSGSVLSVATGRVEGRDVVAGGGDDNTIRIWSPATGEFIRDFTGSQAPVHTVDMAGNGLLVAGGGDDGWANLWWLAQQERAFQSLVNLEPAVVTDTAFVDPANVAVASSAGSVWICDLTNGQAAPVVSRPADSVTAIATRHPVVFDGTYEGLVRGWHFQTGEEIHRFDGHPGGVRSLASGDIGGAAVVVSGGKDHLVRVWDLTSGIGRILEGHTGTVRGVAIGTVDGESIIVSGSDDGTVRIWGDVTADHVEWLSDSPADHDLLVRRPLARSIATRLRRMNEDEPGTSFLVHIDGPWGTGKSTLLRFLQKELEPDFTPVHFNAWSEAGVGPAWWALLTSLRTAVGKQRRWPGRMWLRIRESFARLRRVGAPFVLAFIGLLLVAGLIWWFVNPSFTRAQDIFKSAAGILAMIGTVGAGALVASRFLLWDSARGAKLFEQHNTNPMLEVTRHFGWLMARSKKPVVFFIDDLDRCPDTYVVELLDNVQTLVRDASKRSAHFVVSADGAWIRVSYEQAYEKFSTAVSAPGQPLGYLFLDKFFQLRVPVPSIDAPRQQQYLRELLRGPVTPPQELAVEEDRVRQQLTRSTTEAQVVKTLQGTSAEVRDRVAGTALDQLSTPAAVAATEHSLQRFAVLLPPNPRTMKRFVNAYSAMRAVRTLEGNAVGVESLALWTIIEIRWPSLADHLRARPESIELVGREDLDAVPEELRVLFGDAALRMIVKSDFGADVIRSCCGASIPATDR